jgi:hypothetical protein
MDKLFAFQGYYVAAYTQRVGDGLYIGHAKISVERPRDPATSEALEQVSSVGSYADELRALQAAEFQARQVIDSLQPNWAPFTAPGAVATTR